MAEIYKAVFTCPEYDEREVWYVSSRQSRTDDALPTHKDTGKQ